MSCNKIAKIHNLVNNNACTKAIEQGRIHPEEHCEECFSDFVTSICQIIGDDFAWINGRLILSPEWKLRKEELFNEL